MTFSVRDISYLHTTNIVLGSPLIVPDGVQRQLSNPNRNACVQLTLHEGMQCVSCKHAGVHTIMEAVACMAAALRGLLELSCSCIF